MVDRPNMPLHRHADNRQDVLHPVRADQGRSVALFGSAHRGDAVEHRVRSTSNVRRILGDAAPLADDATDRPVRH